MYFPLLVVFNKVEDSPPYWRASLWLLWYLASRALGIGFMLHDTNLKTLTYGTVCDVPSPEALFGMLPLQVTSCTSELSQRLTCHSPLGRNVAASVVISCSRVKKLGDRIVGCNFLALIY